MDWFAKKMIFSLMLQGLPVLRGSFNLVFLFFAISYLKYFLSFFNNFTLIAKPTAPECLNLL